MIDEAPFQEPFSYPSRHRLMFNPGVPNRQVWAIGMVVVQWGMTEFIREQIISHLMGDDTALAAEYQKVRNAKQRNAFWKALIETKMEEPKRSLYLGFVTRLENLNNDRDNIVHRLWGGGMQPGSMGAPVDATVTDAALHRTRDEKMKTKSTDARANVRWWLTYDALREIMLKIAQLNGELFSSFLPPGTSPRLADVWGFLGESGKLNVGVSPRQPESDQNIRNETAD